MPRHRSPDRARKRLPLLILAAGLAMLCVVTITSYVLGRGMDAPARDTATRSPSGSDALTSVLAEINLARRRAGLPAYTFSTGLEASAQRHARLIANGCGLADRCRAELSPDRRNAAADVISTRSGENVVEAVAPVADTPQSITSVAVELTSEMLAEAPPHDGRRLNLLNPAFTFIGIAIVRASSGTVWMTEDFSDSLAASPNARREC